MNSRLAAVLAEEQHGFDMSFNTAASPVRRLDPEVVESTSTTPSAPKKARRFAPEPVETSSRTSRKSSQQRSEHIDREDAPPNKEPSTQTPKPRRRFAPEPVETTTRSSHGHEHRDHTRDADGAAPPLLPHERLDKSEEPPKPARRRFKPQLIETAQRRRVSGDSLPTMLPGDKTNVSPGDLKSRPSRPDATPLPPSNTPNASMHQVYGLRPPANRQGSIKPHYNSRVNTRQHSYQVPSLASIASSESDEGTQRQDDSDTSEEIYKDATRMRESVDERFTGYLLSLAARQAEKQLREQEAAAFPTSDFHQPIAHYMNTEDSDEEVSEPQLDRSGRTKAVVKDSADDDWAMREMRRHGENVYKQNQAKGKTKQFDVEFDSPKLNEDIWRNAGGKFDGPNHNQIPKNMIGGRQQDPDLKQMRKAASPPMLGNDIEFPRCRSPDNARFDVTQGSDYLKRQMCYLSEQTGEGCGGLWGGQKKEPEKSAAGPTPSAGGGWLNIPKVKSPESPARPKSPGGGAGLWGGFCTGADRKEEEPVSGLITPLTTPKLEKEDPFATLFSRGSSSAKNSYTNLTTLGNSPVRARKGTPTHSPTQSRAFAVQRSPPSPPGSNSSSDGRLAPPADIDARLALEAKVSAEFGDSFVTQVYNYLSLGYPSLARKFDDELSRISKYNVDELREDDMLTGPRGHVRLGEDEMDTTGERTDEDMCKRWKALRRYVREWGRQMVRKEMEGRVWNVGDPHRAWGVQARRGSWGN